MIKKWLSNKIKTDGRQVNTNNLINEAGKKEMSGDYFHTKTIPYTIHNSNSDDKNILRKSVAIKSTTISL